MASKSSVSLLFAVLFFSSFCFFKANGFDYFMLSLQRANTYCQGTTECCSSNKCCLSDNGLTDFTIHGLWPEYDDGTYPTCCSQSNFDMNAISPLTGVLEKYWPTLNCSLGSTCDGGKGVFWAHEWAKHGTCAYPVIRDQYSFFLNTLNLYFKYNVTHILNEARYVTSDSATYPIVGIASAVKEVVGGSPILSCTHGTDSLEELRLCFDKNFKPRDCLILTHSCPEYVSLPTYTPSGLRNVKTAGLRNVKSAIPWLLENGGI